MQRCWIANSSDSKGSKRKDPKVWNKTGTLFLSMIWAMIINMTSNLVITTLLLCGVLLCRGILFKRSSATIDQLENGVSFMSNSNIECASACYVKMKEDTCTAYSYDNNSEICTCGRKRPLLMPNSGVDAVLHVLTTCIGTATDTRPQPIQYWNEFFTFAMTYPWFMFEPFYTISKG